MKHLGTMELETPRLILRRFTMTDAQAVYDNWASDDGVTKFLTWPTHDSVEISQMVVSDWVSHYGEDHNYQWAIVPKDVGEPIGSISCVHWDDRVGRVEIGYCIGRNWWHQGFTTEALTAVIRYFFEQVGVNRVEACHDANNPHSGDVMKKCGMHYEGTLRQYGLNNQGVCDICWYGLVARDREGIA